MATQLFGKTDDGDSCTLFTLNSGNGCNVSLSEFGAAITSIKLTNAHGVSQEICLGFDVLDGQQKDRQHIGVTVGRYANRIANACFELNGKTYHLDDNIPPHQLHGGHEGFGRKMWLGTSVLENENPVIRFTYTSPDGEMGYPGNVNCSVTYRLSSNNVLAILYQAISDRDTYVNLTNHAYFNLGSRDHILDHEVKIYAEAMTPVNRSLLVIGKIESTQHGQFNFSHSRPIRFGIENPNPQMRLAGGYDINYIIGLNDGKLKPHAVVCCAETGIKLVVKSTQPCLQFYTGNNLNNTPARDGTRLKKHGGFCLEAQDYPNGMNVDNLLVKPLKAGELYHQVIEYHFSTYEASE
ncbi:aldose epimerase family protein [Shewanella surugensis]|uniref:Aldose 1-epimerase n=1 Tax=Shewanella surugensis TaxID=212020 RepID=A0ABT0L7X5_9GAMM|nr:aldose epimerase family protein [Shewanella surugensis]MCL1123776.1 galactose mutarotase [Shewanella surugensis]